MLRNSGWGLAVLSAVLLGLAVPAQAAEKVNKDRPTFAALTAPAEASVRTAAFKWLQEQGKATARQEFDALWDNNNLSMLDRLTATFALGDAEAAQLLSKVRDLNVPAPTQLPALLADGKKSEFFRANMALAYARALSNRKAYEEVLATLKEFKPEQVVDPAAFLFHKAVAEHGLGQKKNANDTIARLLDDVPSAPERYKIVATLMHFDMVSWKDKDLGAVARKMDISGRRLDLQRGGQQTQKVQKDIVARLDEIIKKLENDGEGWKGKGWPSKGQKKPGSSPGSKPGSGNGGNTNQPAGPMSDSNPAQNSGPGHIDAKKLEELKEAWGKLPPREREQSIRELTKDMPARYREVITEYFRKSNEDNR